MHGRQSADVKHRAVLAVRVMLLAGAIGIAGSAQAASFPCARAATAMERLICADPELGRRDALLAGAYAQALRAPGAARVRIDQRIWLDGAQRCSDGTCLAKAYDDRLDRLLQNAPVRHFRLAARNRDYALTVRGPRFGVIAMQFDGTEVGPRGVARGDVNTGSYAGFLPARGGSFSPAKVCRVTLTPAGPGTWRLDQRGDSLGCGMGDITPASGLYRLARQ